MPTRVKILPKRKESYDLRDSRLSVNLICLSVHRAFQSISKTMGEELFQGWGLTKFARTLVHTCFPEISSMQLFVMHSHEIVNQSWHVQLHWVMLTVHSNVEWCIVVLNQWCAKSCLVMFCWVVIMLGSVVLNSWVMLNCHVMFCLVMPSHVYYC